MALAACAAEYEPLDWTMPMHDAMDALLAQQAELPPWTQSMALQPPGAPSPSGVVNLPLTISTLYQAAELKYHHAMVLRPNGDLLLFYYNPYSTNGGEALGSSRWWRNGVEETLNPESDYQLIIALLHFVGVPWSRERRRLPDVQRMQPLSLHVLHPLLAANCMRHKLRLARVVASDGPYDLPAPNTPRSPLCDAGGCDGLAARLGMGFFSSSHGAFDLVLRSDKPRQRVNFTSLLQPLAQELLQRHSSPERWRTSPTHDAVMLTGCGTFHVVLNSQRTRAYFATHDACSWFDVPVSERSGFVHSLLRIGHAQARDLRARYPIQPASVDTRQPLLPSPIQPWRLLQYIQQQQLTLFYDVNGYAGETPQLNPHAPSLYGPLVLMKINEQYCAGPFAFCASLLLFDAPQS
jgi:hypothetical protein